MSSKIAITLRGLPRELQLHSVHARPKWSPRKHRVLVGMAMDAVTPFIHELVLSSSVSGLRLQPGVASQAMLISYR